MRTGILAAALVVRAAGQTSAPDTAAQSAMISRTRDAALAYGDRLRDFICTQIITRSVGSSPAGSHWKRLETQEIELNYFDRREHYKLLKVNGQTTNPAKRIKPGYFQSYGQFGSGLQAIFDPKAKAAFEWDHAEGRSCVFRYQVPESSSTVVITADFDQVRLGHRGTVWTDCQTGAVTRFSSATDTGEVRRRGQAVALGFLLDVRYGLATIGSAQFLLPQSAVQTALFGKTWTKAEIEFQNYRKYEADSSIRFDGEETGQRK